MPEPPPRAAERDLYRDTWVRYLGYANEVGEAFRSLVPAAVVWLSYGVASSYVLADAVDKGKKAGESVPILNVARDNPTLSPACGLVHHPSLVCGKSQPCPPQPCMWSGLYPNSVCGKNLYPTLHVVWFIPQFWLC
ncbi:mitochondrial fission process protein 1 isoform X2 [Echinops telfairi]|uniref:Mitochondrial fission process protein 1 isoform X2 n=1 Tax=Echinops telfairi TaxID=9371 RepID=A0AC55D1E6_ECHTE|nr:mitochondrial fission process protein 1 isoform X2 [Echinops telfairi]